MPEMPEPTSHAATCQAHVTPTDYHYMLYGFHLERARLRQYMIHADSARRHYCEWLLHCHTEMVGYHAHQMRVELEMIRQRKVLGFPVPGEELPVLG